MRVFAVEDGGTGIDVTYPLRRKCLYIRCRATIGYLMVTVNEVVKGKMAPVGIWFWLKVHGESTLSDVAKNEQWDARTLVEVGP